MTYQCSRLRILQPLASSRGIARAVPRPRLIVSFVSRWRSSRSPEKAHREAAAPDSLSVKHLDSPHNDVSGCVQDRQNDVSLWLRTFSPSFAGIFRLPIECVPSIRASSVLALFLSCLLCPQCGMLVGRL